MVEINHALGQIWTAYLEYHPRAVLSPERQRLIERRIGEGFPVEILVDAVHGCHMDPWYSGKNDRDKKYQSLGLILRDADRIETFAEVAQEAREKRIRAERRRVQIEKSLAEEQAEEQESVPPPADLMERLRRTQ